MRKTSLVKKTNKPTQKKSQSSFKNNISKQNHPARQINVRRIMAKATLVAIAVVFVTVIVAFVLVKLVR